MISGSDSVESWPATGPVPVTGSDLVETEIESLTVTRTAVETSSCSEGTIPDELALAKKARGRELPSSSENDKKLVVLNHKLTNNNKITKDEAESSVLWVSTL